ncbi:Ras-GEF domain-containing family member 1C [Myotis brandtii]|uniref:Ras-GEF domain-containing family member 1C n=1 Tax=Myotis brandtii TaxID=109478 RepID=S7MRD7_MYOBR|nr:Ras-GEF domain-containing family member 1C [Myotis brandtii]
MPRTPRASDTVIPGSPSPPRTEPRDHEQAEQPVLGGAPSSASLDTLIQQLVPTANYYPEKTYIFTFLLSSRLFIEPRELLARVCQLCIEQQQLDEPGLDKPSQEAIPNISSGDLMLQARVRKFGPKLLQLLAEWTETFPRDFQEEATIGLLKDVVGRLARSLRRGPCGHFAQRHFHHLSPELRHHQCGTSVALLSLRAWSCPGPRHVWPGTHAERGCTRSCRLCTRSWQPRARGRKAISCRTQPRASIRRELLGVCSDPYRLAQQLTLVELARLRHIGPEEFVQAFVNKDPLASTKLSKKKRRAQVIEFFIDVACECFNIGNFNSLMAIVSGMNMSPVSRLKKTWAKVKTAKLFILEHQMDPTGNFCNYRTALRGAAHRSLTAHSSQEKIVIPFFSLLVKDIYFLNEGCANRLPNGHVNFEKFLELAKQVGEFITWKQVECPFEQEPSITHYLCTAPSSVRTVFYFGEDVRLGELEKEEEERLQTPSAALPRLARGQGRPGCLTALHTVTPWSGTRHSDHKAPVALSVLGENPAH